MTKNKLLLLLVLLMTAATGAWAQDAYDEFTTVDPEYTQLEFTGEHIKITGTYICEDGMFVMSNCPVTISALNGKVITKVELTVNLLEEWNNTYAILSTPNATIEGTYAEGQKITITPTGAKASEITLSANVDAEKATFLVKNWKVYYADAGPTTYSITLDEGTGNKDSQNWEIKPKSSELSGGEDVTVKYNGSREVKSVTVVKKVVIPDPIALSAVTADNIGSVVTSDGNVYPAKTPVLAGKTAVGILGKVTSTGHGLILALQNASEQNWNTINGWTSVNNYAGTTLKRLPNAAHGTNLTSYTTLGATAVSNWAVAQKSDYDAIFTNLGSKTGDSDGTTYDANVNAYITTGVGGTALSGEYWSATMVNGDLAWDFTGSWWHYQGFKDESRSVRPVLGF